MLSSVLHKQTPAPAMHPWENCGCRNGSCFRGAVCTLCILYDIVTTSRVTCRVSCHVTCCHVSRIWGQHLTHSQNNVTIPSSSLQQGGTLADVSIIHSNKLSLVPGMYLDSVDISRYHGWLSPCYLSPVLHSVPLFSHGATQVLINLSTLSAMCHNQGWPFYLLYTIGHFC